MDDVALAFNDLNINIPDLEEYISNVDPVPCIINVPKFPISKESNLNFLKPGSKEVVTRPVHIHEHLPPIQPHEGNLQIQMVQMDVSFMFFFFNQKHHQLSQSIQRQTPNRTMQMKIIAQILYKHTLVRIK